MPRQLVAAQPDPLLLPQAVLMVFNGVAVLNNERFLEKRERPLPGSVLPQLSGAGAQRRHPVLQWPPIQPPHCAACPPLSLPPPDAPCPPRAADGWGFSQMSQVSSLKMSIIGGIHAVQYFRSEPRAAAAAAATVQRPAPLAVQRRSCVAPPFEPIACLSSHTVAQASRCPAAAAGVLMVLNFIVIFVKLLFG